MSAPEDGRHAVARKDFAVESAPKAASTTPLPSKSSMEISGSQAEKGDQQQPPDVYDRFSGRRKKLLTALISYNAFISPFTASIFLPSVPQIAADLGSTATIISVTIAIFIVSMGTAPLIWSPLSGFYGRRPIYLASLPIMVVGTIGVAFSRTVPQLIGTRILQGMGSSSSLAVGAGSIGDIYRPTERSNAMGWFYSGALIGSSFAPLIGAAFTQFTSPGWRAAQYFVAGMAALAMGLTYFVLPETMHAPIPHDTLKQERGKKFVPYVFNPLAILGLFCWPNICAITFVSSATMLMAYIALVPISSAFGDQYGITDPILIGCIFISSGIGNIVGSRIAGPMADATVRKYIKKRGYRRPEDRLRAAVIGLGIVMPVCHLIYGWLLQTSAGGVAPPIVFLFLQNVGLMLILAPLNTYAVDSMQDRVIAVNNWVRYLFSAAASAFVLPMSHAIGWGWTSTVAAALMWISFGILLLTIRYGHHWRERANKRYGYDTISEDEKHPPSIRGEEGVDIDIVKAEAEAGERVVVDEDDTHTDLPQRPRAPTMRGGKGLERVASGKLSRQRSAGSLPDVREVLHRTASVTASVHGGG